MGLRSRQVYRCQGRCMLAHWLTGTPQWNGVIANLITLTSALPVGTNQMSAVITMFICPLIHE